VLDVRLTGRTLAIAARAADEATAHAAVERARFWTWADEDLTPFLERFADDPLIGPSVREAPWLRPFRRAMPFEALLCAICEQLVTDERAQAIKRDVVRRHGPRLGTLRDFPDAGAVARLAPADLQACDLAAERATALIRAAREVDSGRVDLLDPAARRGAWRRLRAIRGIGPWTLSTLALHGQGHHDALAAGDHAFRTLVGEVRTGRPRAKADEADVVAFLEPYAGWRGVAGWHLLRTGSRAIRERLASAGRR
jgi:3-methyladenine DNA glycosylase/8-oxoguanine DNA glycosylase